MILGRFQQNLEKFRLVWKSEEAIIQLKKKVINDAVESHVGKAALAQVEIQKFVDLVQTVAQLSIEHKDLPGLVMPPPKPLPQVRESYKKKLKADKGKKQKELGEKKKAQAQKKKEAVEEPGEIDVDADENLDEFDELFEIDEPEKNAEATEGEPELKKECLSEKEGEPEKTGGPEKNAEATEGEPVEQPDELGKEGLPEEEGEPEKKGEPEKNAEATEGEPGQQPDELEKEEPVEKQPGSAEDQAKKSAEFAKQVKQEAFEAREKAKLAAPGAEVVLEEESMYEDEKIALEKMDELSEGVKSFEKWVKDLSVEQKTLIIQHHLGKATDYSQMLSYMAFVKSTATFQGCGKCRYAVEGCEKCCHSKAQNYVLRRAETPYWWKKYRRACF